MSTQAPLDIREVPGTIACESCGAHVAELLEPGEITDGELAGVLDGFLKAHEACGALVMLREDDAGDLYVAGELSRLQH